MPEQVTVDLAKAGATLQEVELAEVETKAAAGATLQEVQPARVETPGKLEQPKVYSEGEYKGLQRKFAKMQQDYENLMGQRNRIEDVAEKLDVLDTSVALLLEAQAKGELADDETTTRIAELQEKRKKTQVDSAARQVVATKAREYWDDINEMITDAGVQLEDVRLSGLATMWNSGEYEKAWRETRKVTTNILKAKQTDIEAEVQRRMGEERKKKQKIDVGVPGAPASDWSNLPPVEKIKRGLTEKD